LLIASLFLQLFSMSLSFWWLVRLRYAFVRPFFWIGLTHVWLFWRRATSIWAFSLVADLSPEFFANHLVLPNLVTLSLLAAAFSLRRCILRSSLDNDLTMKTLEALARKLFQ